MKIYIPPQVKRLLFFLSIFILIFIVARRLVIPDTFGDLGHYRAASLIDNQEHALQYAGHEACAECHAEIAEGKDADMHSDLNCETCHGPGLAHAEDPEKVDIKINKDRDACGICHTQDYARNRNVVFQIDLKEHNIDKKCIDCHNPHMPWEMKE